MNQSKEILIAGIEEDARQEEEKILAEAGQRAADKRKYGDQKNGSILADARQRAEKQAGEIKRKVVSAVELEVRRRSLRLRDAVVQDLMQRVEERMKLRVAAPGYREVLRQWIVEAARGLNVDAAEVNASAAERGLIDEALLREAMEILENKVALTLSKTDPLGGQGVVLTSANGRMAFNNQVRTRIQRHQREIQGLIHEALFE
ncbi:MAG: V-type ATP synthase subunit E family protein, partial [Verrucomicrobiota bacterium]